MRTTKNDIPLAKRKKTVDILAAVLADAIDLKTQVKQAHWNVKGATFLSLHELFDKVAGEVDDAADTVAERIVQLGGHAEGTLRLVAKRTRLKEYPAVDSARAHVDAVSSVLAAFIAPARKAIDETAGLGDAVTSDMLTGIVGGLDKLLWFVESHLEK